MATLRWDDKPIIEAVHMGATRGVSRAAIRTRATAMRNANGSVLKKRTGNLGRSITTIWPDGEDNPRAIVGTGVSYAKIQDTGGTVKPGPGKKYLAVPLPGALTKSGTVRGRNQAQSADGPGTFGPKRKASLRNTPGLSFFKNPKTGKMFLVRRKGKGKNAKMEFLYVLKESVTIPQSRWFSSAVKEEENSNRALIRDEVRKALKGVGIDL